MSNKSLKDMWRMGDGPSFVSSRISNFIIDTKCTHSTAQKWYKRRQKFVTLLSRVSTKIGAQVFRNQLLKLVQRSRKQSPATP